MKILSIETSCDESAISIVEAFGGLKNPEFKVVSSALHSQIEMHKEFGGVYPSLAKREHSRNLVPLLKEVLSGENGDYTKISEDKGRKIQKILEREPRLLELFQEAVPNLKKPNIDYIAVTVGPGLEPALWVGINFAKALSVAWNVPVIPSDHMEGHIASVLSGNKEKIDFPAVALLVSGGHTDLYEIKKWGEYKRLGGTRDDAVGEAFDKVARLLGLGYPGGPEISKLAEKSRSREPHHEEKWKMPRPMLNSDDLDFSFSGIKTHVLYLVRDMSNLSPENKESIAREFEDAVIEVLVQKTKKALEETSAKTLIVAGGVTANKELRKQMKKISKILGVPSLLPPQELSTDNSTMIALASFLKLNYSKQKFEVNPDLEAQGNLEL